MNDLKETLASLYDKYVMLCKEQTSKCSVEVPEININDSHYLEIIYYLVKPTYSEFAKDAGISKPAATQIIKRFIEKGYVKKKQSPDDKRVFHIILLAKFKQYFDDVSRAEEGLFEKTLSILTPKEVDSLTKILNKLDDNL